MGEVHELRLRSNRFTENINLYIESVVDDNQELIDLNREQLRAQMTTLDKEIRPEYTDVTFAKKGFWTPNLYDTGDMFRSMTIESTKGGKYFIKSTVEYWEKLNEKYDDAFGIALSKMSRAKAITSKALAQLYKELVIK